MNNVLRSMTENVAAIINAGDIGYTGVTGGGGTIGSILNTVYFWAGIIAVVVLIISGFLYVTSQGDASKVAQAKNAILGSVIGLIVIIAAWGVTTFIIAAAR